jgi:hypothetical protein
MPSPHCDGEKATRGFIHGGAAVIVAKNLA